MESKISNINVRAPATKGVPVDPDMLPYMLNRLNSRANQLWIKQLRSHGLTIGRWHVLSVLSRYDGSRVGTIADISGGEQPAVSRVIDQMERDGLVSRRPSIDDSRAVEVWLTKRGRQIIDDLLPEAEEFVARMLRSFDENEVRQLAGFLERLMADMSD
jgi:DNA-binding MarR family transcriptional regulator